MKRAVFPGSFDPITIGHQSVISRALPLFDEIIIAIGVNSTKNSMFDAESRKEWIIKSFKNHPKIRVDGDISKLVPECIIDSINNYSK